MMTKLSFVCFSQNNWENRKARKQQFMLHLSQRDDVGKVLYVEPPLNVFRLIFFLLAGTKTTETVKRWTRALTFKSEPLSDKLFVFTPLVLFPFSFRAQWIYDLNLFLSMRLVMIETRRLGFHDVVLWLYHPFDHMLLKRFKGRILSVFDWAEEWVDYFVELTPRRRKDVAVLQEKVIAGSDIVFVVSTILLKKAKQVNPDSHLLRDGASVELFQREVQAAEDIAGIQRPILGYTGTITERMDIELLEFISSSIPEASLVLIGDIHIRPVDRSSLAGKKNVHFLGGKPYEDLPSYVKNFDVCLVPYKTKLNALPTKVFDYLACGKPIVSCDVPDAEHIKDWIRIARTKEQFVEFIRNALASDSVPLKQLRIEAAKENTWFHRTDAIMKIMRERTFKS